MLLLLLVTNFTSYRNTNGESYNDLVDEKQPTPRKVKWKLRRKGADLDKKGKVAIKNEKMTNFCLNRPTVWYRTTL